MLNWYELGPFTVFDVETTGLSCRRDRIVELAALRIDKDGVESTFHTLIHPGRPIPPCTTRVHHITDEMVADAPHFPRIGHDFLKFIAGSTLVAHNARFDLGFLQESLARSGLPLWRGKTIDTIRLLKRTHPGLPSYSLQTLRKLFQLADSEGAVAHRAGSDVEWTCQLLGIALSAALEQCRP